MHTPSFSPFHPILYSIHLWLIIYHPYLSSPSHLIHQSYVPNLPHLSCLSHTLLAGSPWTHHHSPSATAWQMAQTTEDTQESPLSMEARRRYTCYTTIWPEKEEHKMIKSNHENFKPQKHQLAIKLFKHQQLRIYVRSSAMFKYKIVLTC